MGATGGVTSRQAREAGDAAMLQQAANIQNGQGLSLPLPWFTADAYWEYADYGGYGATATLSGLLDMYRLPKHAYYFLQSQRDPTLTSTLRRRGPDGLHRESVDLDVADQRQGLQQLRPGPAVAQRDGGGDALARHHAGAAAAAPAVHLPRDDRSPPGR